MKFKNKIYIYIIFKISKITENTILITVYNQYLVL